MRNNLVIGAIAALLIVLGYFDADAQNGKWNVTPPAPYTRADFTRDCIAMAPTEDAKARAEWIARCSKEAP